MGDSFSLYLEFFDNVQIIPARKFGIYNPRKCFYAWVVFKPFEVFWVQVLGIYHFCIFFGSAFSADFSYVWKVWQIRIIPMFVHQMKVESPNLFNKVFLEEYRSATTYLVMNNICFICFFMTPAYQSTSVKLLSWRQPVGGVCMASIWELNMVSAYYALRFQFP